MSSEFVCRVSDVMPHSTLANQWIVTVRRNGEATEQQWHIAMLIGFATDQLFDFVFGCSAREICEIMFPGSTGYTYDAPVMDIVKSLIPDYVQSFATLVCRERGWVYLHCDNGVVEWKQQLPAEFYQQTLDRCQAFLADGDAATLAMTQPDSWFVWSSLKF